MPSSKKPWRTLGISTSSRVWVTHSMPTLGNKLLINNLTLTGQTMPTSFKTSKLSFWTGKAFSTIRLLLQILIVLLLVKWSVLGVKAVYYSFMLTMTATPPLTLFWFCSAFASFFMVWWLRIVTLGTKKSAVVGGLALMFFSLSATLLKTLSTFGKHFIRGPRESVDVLALHEFAHYSKVTPDQKKFVVLAYKTFAGLINLSGAAAQPCSAYLNTAIRTSASPMFYNALTRLQFISTLDVVKGRRWPTLNHDKLEILRGRTLLLYHWRNIHADGANLFKTSSLWASHRLGGDAFDLQRILTLSKPVLTKPQQKLQPSDWLTQLTPKSFIITTLLKPSNAPLRYDLTQHLSSRETPTWTLCSKKL